jgi:hypothetical protein
MTGKRRPVAQVGPVFLIVGGAAGLIGGATHGDLPEDSGAAALQFVADHPAYALVHIVSILGAVLWSIGLAGRCVDRATPTGRWPAAAAGHAALAGAAVMAVQFSIDGIGMTALAALWSEPGASRETFEAIAEIAPAALVGTALTWVVILYGLAPILAGSSLVLTARPVLGWTAVALGAFSVVGGLTLALRVNLLPDWLVFAGATIGVNLWIICLGAAQLRGAPARTSQAIAQ